MKFKKPILLIFFPHQFFFNWVFRKTQVGWTKLKNSGFFTTQVIMAHLRSIGNLPIFSEALFSNWRGLLSKHFRLCTSATCTLILMSLTRIS